MRAHFREGHLENKERRNVPGGCHTFQTQRWCLRYSSGEQFWSTDVRANTGLCRMTHTSVKTLHQPVLPHRTEIWGCVLAARVPRGHAQATRAAFRCTSSIFLCKRGTADRRKTPDCSDIVWDRSWATARELQEDPQS